jgi:hypothetical protein
MAFSVFSFRSIRLVALYALVGIGLLSGVSKAAVINIDLTGYMGDNAGVAEGGFGQVNPFGPSGTRLLIQNGFDFLTYRGLVVDDGIAGIAATGSSTTDQPIKFTAGATIGGSFTYSSSTSTVFSSILRTVGDFGPNSFLGFRTSGGQFGYIEVTWTASTNTFRLISAAYESTPGVAIQTPGGQAPVPEPASAMIASLFLGGAALKRWRSKRS